MKLDNDDLEKAREIRSFLAIHYKEQHNYQSLVQQFGISKERLKKAFKEVSGEEVGSFLTKWRIAHAIILLKKTDENIESIAANVGLRKMKFVNQFKKLIGKSPTQWRLTQVPWQKLHIDNSQYNSFY